MGETLDWSNCKGCAFYCEDETKDACESGIVPEFISLISYKIKFNCPCCDCLIKVACTVNCKTLKHYIRVYDYERTDNFA